MIPSQRPFCAFVSVVMLLLLSVAPLLAQTNGQVVSALIAEGHDLSQRQFNNQAALSKFLEAYAVAPHNDEVLWSISRSYVDIGEHLPATTDAEKVKQLEMYEKALEFANKAITANPSGAMGYTRRAIANGRIALFKGIWGAVDLVKQTKADCEKAIALDPGDNVALYVLARTHARLIEKPRIVRWPLGLGWANLDDAIRYYEKAVALRSDFIMYRLDAARAYIEADDTPQARRHLESIATLATQDEDDERFRQEALGLLQSLRGE